LQSNHKTRNEESTKEELNKEILGPNLRKHTTEMSTPQASIKGRPSKAIKIEKN